MLHPLPIGSGDHPEFGLIDEASEGLGEVGLFCLMNVRIFS